MNESEAPTPGEVDPFSESALADPLKNGPCKGPDYILGKPGDATHDMTLLVNQVVGRFNDLQEHQLRTNDALYGLLGLIYQVHCNLEGNLELKTCLHQHAARPFPDRQQWMRWMRPSRTVAEMLIVMVLTPAPARKVTRHQWNGALKAAVQENVEPTEPAFVNWIKGVGGVIAANKLLTVAHGPDDDDDGDGEGDGHDQPAASGSALERLLKILPSMSKAAPTIKLEIDSASEAHGRLSAALLTPVTDESGAPTGEMLVLKESNDEKLLELFAELALPKVKSLTPEQARKLADKMITRLNRFAIKVGTHPRGRMKPADCDNFIKAAEKLGELDCEGAYFTAQPFLQLEKVEGGKQDHSELTVVNPGFHPLDPGRYIGNAKEGALLAYEVKGPTVRDCRDEYGAWVRSLSRPNESATALDDDDESAPLDELQGESDLGADSSHTGAEEVVHA